MAALPLPDNFVSDATWLVQAIDPPARLARLVRMDAASYRAASFLDDRCLSQQTESRLCDLGEMVAASAGVVGAPANWIFHIGHVGSTLVSRLLGELDGVLSIREPRSLRDLGVASSADRPEIARSLSRLMARGSKEVGTVIVKATSFVSELAPLLVEPGAAAIFLFASPRNYIAGILAGENSVKELNALHEVRMGRLAARGISLTGFDRSEAHRAAAAWACEMTSLEAAADAMPDSNILWADFDVVLEGVAEWLGLATAHFRLSPSAERLEQVAAGQLMLRYSKAQEYDYSPALRAELLADTMRVHLREIEAAVIALGDVARSAPLLDRALRRADQEG